jgi:hypothetical protein
MSSDPIATIKRWTSECASNHAGCATKGKFVPTRLIRVDEHQIDTVRLESPSAHVKWIALTYCWGTSRQYTTTKDNVSYRSQEIIVSKLPQTLQDAVSMTRALGYQ